MPASIVARVVRTPLLAAVAAVALAACSNDPMSPVARQSGVRSSVNAAPASAGGVTTASDGSQPWFRAGTSSGSTGATATTSDGSQPWFRTTTTQSSSATTTDGSQPWF